MDSPAETRLEITDDSREWSENSLEELSSGIDQSASSPVTPESERVHVALSFGNRSSDVSPNHESDSSYSELDSEAEAFYSSLNHQLLSSGTTDSDELAEKPMSYSELMKKLGQYEEELRTKGLKLQESEQEIEKLKGEAEKRDSELDTARREIETKDTDIETEKRRALELQGQVVDLESQLSDLRSNVGNLVDELHVSKERVDASDAVISELKQKFSTEKTKLESDISGLLEKQTFLQSRGEELEDQIKHSDAEKMEMKSKEVKLEAEINALKTDLASRDEHMEALNKDFDKHKLRYDMLMAEKDGVYAEVNNLKAEMRTKDIQIKLMEEQFNQLVYKQNELVSESGKDKNSMEELKLMVKELEKQAELQRNVISEVEEEKREAIRQLCFSLDHYKTGYRQLLRFLSSSGKVITGNHGRVI